MIVEASHYDKVEWNPKPIMPGEYINKPDKTYHVKIGEKRKIILRAPCRIDVGLIDYSALKFTDSADYKAGEMSFACDKYTTVEVELIDDDSINIESKRPALIEYVARLIKGITDYKGGFNIKTNQHPYHHVGFGTSAIISETTVLAINTLFGNPLSNVEVRNLVAFNFVEESDTDNTILFPGASTGGSFNTIINGGFVITSTECEAIFREKIPENMYFIVGTPNVGVKGPECSETDVNCMDWERHNERINAAKSCLWILTEIMPYWVKGDYAKAGNAFYNYTFFGGKSMQMLLYRCGLHDMLFELKETGLEGGWMTSAGPSLVAMTQDENKVDIAKRIFERHNCKEIVVAKGDNEGVIEIEGDESCL